MAKIERLRVLVVGAGGREHALAWKIAQSPSVDFVHVAPGNGGTESSSENMINVNVKVTDFPELVKHSKQNGINLAVIGPEEPLVRGIEKHFRNAGIRCFGPSQAAARMEGSKTYSKDFMQRHGIPTAAFRNFTQYEEAKKYLDSVSHSVVIKASGLAAGKGVIIPQSKEEAHAALKEIMVVRQFGEAGDEVVIEEFLEGEELSVLTFSDGYTIRSLPPAQDHKRALDGDQGPNTGGMGCYAPTKVVNKDLLYQIDHAIVQPTIDSMRREGTPFVGMLFTGLMITKDGPKVLEYNVRGGDPETQTLLPLLSSDTDLARIMVACCEGWLDGVEVKLEQKFSATVVACAEGYPASYPKGRPIELSNTAKDTLVFHAGTGLSDKKLVTTGGRVIASTATGSSIEDAVTAAYKGMGTIKFQGMHFRKDIAHRAFRNPSQRSRRDSDIPLTYASAGVSIDSGNSLVSRIKAAVKATARPGAGAEIGGFGGAVELAKAGYAKESPIIIGAIDGVGTKLKVAFAMNKHDTVGIDLVAMNVNDLIVQGAEPLMFLDCYTCSKLEVDTAAAFVSGVAKGCQISGCALVGGETAEMPGLLTGTEYDAVGCAVGALNTTAGRQILPDLESMQEGDVLLGLGSDGLHSNGFSLVRKIVERKHLSYSDQAPWDADTTVGLSLLTPTRIYVKPLLKVVQKDLIKGMSHITGGGLTENVPRMIPDNLTAQIDVSSWKRHPVFDWLQTAGKVSSQEMGRAFNNGIGMVLVVSKIAAGEVTRLLEEQGERVFRIGELVKRKNEERCVLQKPESWKSS